METYQSCVVQSTWHFFRIELKQKKLNPIIILIRLLIVLCSPTLVYIAAGPAQQFWGPQAKILIGFFF